MDNNKMLKKINKSEEDIIKVNEQLDNNTNEIKAKIKSLDEKSATKVDVEVERNRIDLLTKIENGETEGNTELLDIRVSADGVVNGTAGETVRDIARGNGIVAGAITPDKTDFINYNITQQLLNYDGLTMGQYYGANDVSNPDKVGSESTFATIKLKLIKGKKYIAFSLSKDFSFYIENGEIIKVGVFEGYSIYNNSKNSLKSNDTPCIFTCPTNDYLYLSFRVNVDTLMKPMLFKSDNKIYLEDYKEYGYILEEEFKIPKLKLEDVSANETNFAIDHSLTQLLNYDDLNLGKYYKGTNTSDPNSMGTVDSYACIKIKLKKGKKYIGYAIGKDFTFYVNDSGNIVKLVDFEDYEIYSNVNISGLSNDMACMFTCPTDNYMYISVRVNIDTMLKPMLFEANSRIHLKNYIPVNEKINNYITIPNLKLDMIKENIITVKKDGTGDFVKIVDAVNSINDSSIYNQYEIHIYDGDYDILEELGGDVFLNTITSDKNENQGLNLPDFVHLFTNGTVKMRFEIDDEKCNEYNVRKCSTLNLNKTNKIEGLEIIAKNCRYAVHDECGNANHNIYRLIKNCRMIHKGVTNKSLWNSPAALGGGTGSGGRYDIVNLYCEAPLKPFGYHNNANQGRNIFNIDGLITKSTTDELSYDVAFAYYKENSINDMNYVYAKNCILSKSMVVKQETQSVASDNVFTLYKFNVLENQTI